MSDSDDEEHFHEKIKESWALFEPPSSVDELLSILDKLLTGLLKIESWELDSHYHELTPTMYVLVEQPLITHSDVDVKVSVAACLTQITRITAPDPPYKDEEDMKEAFKIIVSAFQNLHDTSSRSYSKRICILRTVARIKLWHLVMDLDCETLVIHMLEIFFMVIRDHHPNCVFSSMENIVAGVFEYLSQDALEKTLEVILKSIRDGDDKLHKLSRRTLAERVLSHFARESDFQPYLSGVVASSDVSIREYSRRLCSVIDLQQECVAREEEDKQKAAGTNAPKDESGGKSGVSNESWVDTESRKRHDYTNAKDEPQSFDNLSNTDLYDTCEEKPAHAEHQIKEKGKTPSSVKQVDSDIKEETEPEAFMDRKNVLSSSPDDSSAISFENEKKTNVQALPAADKTPIVNFSPRAEDILEDQILDSWALLDPPSSVDELLTILDKLLDTLSNVNASELEFYWFALSPTRIVLSCQEFLYHSDVDVKVAVAACLSQIIRIFALNHRYRNEVLKELFQVIVSSFENLDDISSRSYTKRIFILETVAKPKLWDVILNLGCGALFSEMFTNFLKYIRDHHPSNVFSSMKDIMTSVLECFPEETLQPILTYLRDDYEVPRVSRKLAEKVLGNCATNSKFKPYLARAVKSSGVSLGKYSNIVRSILEGPSSDLQQDQLVGNGKEDIEEEEEAWFSLFADAPKDESGASACDEVSEAKAKPAVPPFSETPQSGASACDEVSEAKAEPAVPPFSETPQAYTRNMKSEINDTIESFTSSMPKEEEKKLGRRRPISSIFLWSLCILSVSQLFRANKRGRF